MVLLLLVWLLSFGAPAAAQPARTPAPSPPAPAAEPGSELRVFFLSMGQGDAVWEQFGHDGIWIQDRANRTSMVYNWGVFDFEQEQFIVRFMKGDMWYQMASDDFGPILRSYQGWNRSVWAQELNLTPAQRLALKDFVEWNNRPENQFYHYDYYRDNCSTRARDVIDRVLGGQLKAQTETLPANTTYRDETKRIFQNHVPLYIGTMTIMGHPIDRPLSVWEDMFLPLRMQAALRDVKVRDASGAMVPLVLSEELMFQATRAPEPSTVPNFLLLFTALGVALGTLLVLLGWYGAVGRGWGGAGYATLGMLWSLAIGFIGTVIALGWPFTDHIVMRQNENILLANPLPLAVLVLLPLFLLGGRRGSALVWVTTASAGLALAALVLQILPAFTQPNGEIIGLYAPIHVGMAIATWCRVRMDAGRAIRPIVM